MIKHFPASVGVSALSLAFLVLNKKK